MIRIMYTKLQSYSLSKKVVYVCQVSKLQHTCAMGITLLSVLKTTTKPDYIKLKSKISKKNDSNLGDPPRSSF